MPKFRTSKKLIGFLLVLGAAPAMLARISPSDLLVPAAAIVAIDGKNTARIRVYSSRNGISDGRIFEFQQAGKAREMRVEAGELCRRIRQDLPVVGHSFVVAIVNDPAARQWYLDCDKQDLAPAVAPATPQAPAPPPRSSPPPPAAAPAAPDPLTRRVDQLERKVAELEKSFGDLRCRRLESGSAQEVRIAVLGQTLRFARFQPESSEIDIGLGERQAMEFHQQQQALSKEPLLPRILRAVPNVRRPLAPFYLQDRLLDEALVAELLPGAGAAGLSVRQAQTLLDKLNHVCAGRAQFVLPAEEQMVAVYRRLYDPVQNGLVPCEVLSGRRLEPGGIVELLGNRWQLTASRCEPFGPGGDSCSPGSLVRKGGIRSPSLLECIPEYRGEAFFDAPNADTGIRLVLSP